MLTFTIFITIVITAGITLFVTSYIVRKSIDTLLVFLLEKIQESKKYLLEFEPNAQFYPVNFEDDFAQYIIAPIKLTTVLFGKLPGSGAIVTASIKLLTLVKFDITINKIIALHFLQIEKADHYARFHNVVHGNTFDDYETGEVLRSLIYADTYKLISTWKGESSVSSTTTSPPDTNTGIPM